MDNTIREKPPLDIRDYNPFVKDLRMSDSTDLRKIRNTDYKLVDKINNTVIDDNIVLAEEKLSDKSIFTKTYEEGHRAQEGISKGAANLLNHILHHKLKFNSDVFDLVMQDYMTDVEQSKPTVYAALNELLDKRIIAKRYRYPNSYFINPNMFYKGERRFLKMKYK